MADIKPFLTADMLAKISKMPPTKRQSAMQVVAREEWARCSQDLFYWIDPSRHLVPYVYTRDPKPMHKCKLCSGDLVYDFDKRDAHLQISHDLVATKERERAQYFTTLSTIRMLTMKPYFEPIIETWLNERMIALEKSRDMMATWLMVICYTWDTIFHEGRQSIFQSETASKTLDLIRRAGCVYDNQPKWLKEVHKVFVTQGVTRAGLLTVPSLQSEIIGFPQGESQVRQYHPSGFFSDEAAFNVESSACFAAIQPAINAGGKYTAISSANPGWFEHVCRDTLESF